MKLKDKVAIVTGSTKGIGEGIIRELSAEGAKVTVVARHEEEGVKLAKELGSDEGRAIFVKTDVTKVEDVKNMVAKTIEAFGKIDILVNNAGYHNSKGLEALSDEDWDLILKTNLYSMYYCSKYCLEYLKETKGTIISTSSMVGKVGQGNACAYAATKGGQLAMTRNMAIDLAKYGIRVNAILPGWIESPLVDEWFAAQEDPEASKKYIYGAHPIGRIGTPKDCGRAVVFLASQEESGFLTGVLLDIDGGITLGY